MTQPNKQWINCNYPKSSNEPVMWVREAFNETRTEVLTVAVEIFNIVCKFSNYLWISSCYAIVCEFHHIVQLFMIFTMLWNWLWISSCCAIVCEFHHVVKWFVNHVVWVLLGCCYKKSIISLNEEYFLTIILTYWTISRVATATKNQPTLFWRKLVPLLTWRLQLPKEEFCLTVIFSSHFHWPTGPLLPMNG